MKNLSIGVQINLIALISLAGFVLVGILYYTNHQTEKGIQDTMLREVRGVEYTDRIRFGFLQARRREKDFFLRKEKKYADEHLAVSESVMPFFDKLKTIHKGADEQKLIDDMKAGFTDYVTRFKEIVGMWDRIGLTPKKGLRGRLRNAAHEIERVVVESNDINMLATLLQMRRAEKDFMMRKGKKYIMKINKFAKTFGTQLSGMKITKAELNSLGELSSVIKAYGAAIIKAKKLVGNGYSSSQIDKAIKIDDRPAINALAALAKAAKGRGAFKLPMVIRIRDAIGYGGMADQFKNYIISHDPSRIKKVKAKIDDAMKAIEDYKAVGMPDKEIRIIETDLSIYMKSFISLSDLIFEEIGDKNRLSKLYAEVEPKLLSLSRKGTEDSHGANKLLRENSSRTFIMILTSIVIISIIVFLLAIIIGRLISKPVGALAGTMGELAKDNMDVDVPGMGYGNEIGEMAQGVRMWKESAIERVQLRQQQEEQQRMAEEEKKRVIREFADEIGGLASAAVDGDLTVRLGLDGKEDELLEVSQSLNKLVETVEKGLGETGSFLAALSVGDLTKRVEGEYKGAFLSLKNDSNTTAEQLGRTVGEISGTTGLVLSASSEIAEGADDLASRTEQQASSLEQTAAAMEELVATVRQNADNSKQANQFSSSARDSAQKGGEIVSKAVSAMSEIEESSEKISDIVKMIDEIAFQTNLLALNAAVEAARAGEAGKGFAVVASEVRALAQRSSEASKEIKTLIDSSVSQIKDGVQLVNQTGETLEEIVTSVKRVADIVSEISSASQEQATGLDEVNTAVTSMDEMTQQNAALVEETTAAAQSLEGQANALSKLVSFFNTGAEQPAKPAPAVSSARNEDKQPSADADAGKVASEDTSSSGNDQDWQEF